MSIPAKALFKNISDCGTYIDPSTSELKIDTKMDICYVGSDNTSRHETVQVILDFDDPPAQLQTAMKNAIAAYGAATFDYSFGAGDVLIFSLVKA